MIDVSVNNSIRQLPDNSSIQEAIEILEFKDDSMLGVALNQVFIPKEQWSATCLKQHDLLDILKPVSGG